jgi:hypothetical protein
LDRVAPAAIYIERVLERRNIREQVVAFDQWDGTPNEKWRAVEEYFEKIFRWELRILFSDGHQLGFDDVRQLTVAISKRADELRCSTRELFEAILEFWKIDSWPTRAALFRKVHEFDRCLNRTPAENVLAELKRRRPEDKPSRALWDPTTSQPIRRMPGFLKREQAKKLWDAASYCVQEYGALLNTSLILRYAEFGIQDVRAATEKLTRLIQEMRQRTGRAQPQVRNPLHFLYVNERTSGGIETHLVAHIPPAISDMEEWLRISAVPRIFNVPPDGSGYIFKQDRTSNPKREIRRHFARVKTLCRGLDPALVEDVYVGNLWSGIEPLVRLLGIPEGCCRSIGEISETHRHNESRHLATKARDHAAEEGMPALSAFTPEGFRWITAGWELDEYRDRKALKAAREQTRLDIHEKWLGSSAREQRQLEKALEEWRAQWPKRPEDRPRTWEMWPSRRSL